MSHEAKFLVAKDCPVCQGDGWIPCPVKYHGLSFAPCHVCGGRMRGSEFVIPCHQCQATEIARLRKALGVFADEDAWGEMAPDGQRKFWSPFCGKDSPAAFARKALGGD